MSDVNFAALLSKRVDETERPKVFPAGPYRGIVSGHEFLTSSKKGTPFVRFNVKLISPLEGVDEELFEQAGGMDKLSARKPLNFDFYLTDDALYRLREFLENGLQMNGSGRAFDEMIPETTNAEFTPIVSHSSGERDTVWMNIDSFARAEDTD